MAERLVHSVDRGRAPRASACASCSSWSGSRPTRADRYPHEFSGGQRQRIGIARALAVRPATSSSATSRSRALDVSVQAQILNLLRDLQRELGLTYLFIAHDLAVVAPLSDRVAVMYLGRVVEIGDARRAVCRTRPPLHAALLAAVPVPDPSRRNAPAHRPAAATCPAPIDPPPGCRFHTRCPVAFARCREETPALTARAPGQLAACHLTAP